MFLLLHFERTMKYSRISLKSSPSKRIKKQCNNTVMWPLRFLLSFPEVAVERLLLTHRKNPSRVQSQTLHFVQRYWSKLTAAPCCWEQRAARSRLLLFGNCAIGWLQTYQISSLLKLMACKQFFSINLPTFSFSLERADHLIGKGKSNCFHLLRQKSI